MAGAVSQVLAVRTAALWVVFEGHVSNLSFDFLSLGITVAFQCCLLAGQGAILLTECEMASSEHQNK